MQYRQLVIHEILRSAPTRALYASLALYATMLQYRSKQWKKTFHTTFIGTITQLNNLISLVSIDLTISQKFSIILIPFLFLQPRPETYLLFQTRLYLMSFMNLSRLKLQRNHPLKVHIALCHTPVKNLAQVSIKNGNGYNNSKTKMTMMSAFCFADLVGRAGNAGQLYSAVSQLGQSSPPLRLILTIYILQGIALLLLLLHCTLGYIFHCILFKICF